MKPNTTVTIIRHGETEWNGLGRYQGHFDSPLTERGLAQARAAAKVLANENFDAFYSSDLGRAVKTASIIADRLRCRFFTDKRLREQHYGLIQGCALPEALERDPGYFESLKSGNADYIPRGGESRRQRHERSVAVLTEIAEKHRGGNVLVVTHGGVVDSLFRETLGIPQENPRHYSLYNAALNKFIWSDGLWSLQLWGDVSHLSEAETTDAKRGLTAA